MATTPANERKDIERRRVERQVRQTAAESYAAHCQDMAAMLECIKTELAHHAERAAVQPRDWGYVGDVAYARDVLKGLLRSLLIGRHGWSETQTAQFIEDHLEKVREAKRPALRVRGRRYPTMREALKHQGQDEAAIACDEGYLVVTKQEAERLAAAGKEFAYICDHQGTLVTVPVNDKPESRE